MIGTFNNPGCGECVLLEEYPAIDYALVKRDTQYEPFVAAWGLNKAKGYWNQGHYFQTLDGALEYINNKLIA